MKKIVTTLVLALLLQVGVGSAALAESADKAPIRLTTTGAAAQGFFAVVVEALNAIYRDAYPGSTVTFLPNSVGGGMLAVADGKADISIGLPPVEIQRAIAGQDPFQQSLKGKLFHVMTILEDLDFLMVATKEWSDANKVRSFADLAKAKPKMRLGASNRATMYINVALEAVLKEYGVGLKDIESWGGKVYYNPSGTNLQDLRDGKLDVVFTAGLAPDQRAREVAATLPLVWLTVDRAVLDKIAKPLDMEVVTMPKSYYAFMTEDVPNLRAPTTTAAGAHVPEETVYKMLKAIDENFDRLRAVHPTFKNYTLAQLAKPSPSLPYHPGALKYYREKGVVK